LKLYLNKKKYFLIIALILISDQLTKLLIKSKYSVGNGKTIIKDFFNITYVKNNGAVWGFFSNHASTVVPIIITVFSLITLVVIVFFFLKLKGDCKYELLGISFVLGGALGNILDRLYQGFVVDFLEFIIIKYHWPVFNIADSFISIGVFVLVLSIWKGKCQQL